MKRWGFLVPRSPWESVVILVLVLFAVGIVALMTLVATWCPR
jgi:hypothetical protein